MSNPSFSNIDLWLFELAEGNLSPKQIEQLELFLLQNPELDVERDMWEMAKVDTQVAVFPNQDKLIRKRPVGWYFAGSAALVTSAVLAWWFLPNLFSHDQQNVRIADHEVTRVFVIYRGDDSAGQASLNAQAEGTHHQLNRNAPSAFNHATNTASIPQLGIAFVAQQSINTSPVQGIAPHVYPIDPQATLNPTQNRLGFTEPERGSLETEVLSESLRSPLLDVNPLVLNVAEPVAYVSEVQSLASFLIFEQVEDDAFSALSDVDNSATNGINKLNGTTHQTFSSDYKNSLKSRMSAFGRKIQRMMDNPVALKNFKDPFFHVPGMLPNDINFSSAGTMLSTRVQTLSRLQWLGQENEQIMNQIAVDGYAYGLRGGIGLQIQHGLYRNGGVSVSSAAITYSPKFSISRKISLEPSLRFKMGNKTLASSKMQGVNRVEIDRGNAFAFYPESEPIGKTLWYHDLGAGLMVNTEWFYAGVQVDNMFRHQDIIYNVDLESPRRAEAGFIANVGTDWVSRRENLSLSPYLVYQYNERLSEAWLGATFRWNWLTAGASISTGMEPAASLGLKFDHFALTYNADYTKSVMTGQSALSHQLTLRFVSKPSRFGKRLLNL